MAEIGMFGTCHMAAGPEKKKEGVLNSGPGPGTEWTRRLRLGTGRVWSPTQASGEASSLGSLPSSPLQLTSQPHRSVIHDESKAGLPPSSQKLPSTKSLGDPPYPRSLRVPGPFNNPSCGRILLNNPQTSKTGNHVSALKTATDCLSHLTLSKSSQAVF